LSVHDEAKLRPETEEEGEGSHADGLKSRQSAGNEFILVEVRDPCDESGGLVTNMLRGDLWIARCYP
jgi:hypothetical protein